MPRQTLKECKRRTRNKKNSNLQWFFFLDEDQWAKDLLLEVRICFRKVRILKGGNILVCLWRLQGREIGFFPKNWKRSVSWLYWLWLVSLWIIQDQTCRKRSSASADKNLFNKLKKFFTGNSLFCKRENRSSKLWIKNVFIYTKISMYYIKRS